MAKQRSTGVFSPLNKGSDPRGGVETQWFKLDANTSVDIVPLIEVDEVISCEQCAIWLEDGNISPVWVYIGANDPSNDLMADRRYKAFLPVLILPVQEVRVWSFGKGVHSQLLDIADTIGNIKGADLRVKRTGAGLQTRYSVNSRGTRTDIKRVEEVDIIPMLGPLDREGIEKLICERLGADSYQQVIDTYTGQKIVAKIKAEKPEPAAKVKAKAKAKPVVEEDDEDEEDLEEVELS